MLLSYDPISTFTYTHTILLILDVQLNIEECLDSTRHIVNMGTLDIGLHFPFKEIGYGPLGRND